MSRRKNGRAVGKKNPYFKQIAANRKLAALTLIFILGLVLGALLVRSTENAVLSSLREIVKNFYNIKASQGVLENLLSAFGSDFVYMAFACVLGLCMAGEPVLWLLPLVKGLGLGFVSGYLYTTATLQGVGYCVTTIFPAEVLFCAALIFACNESIMMSRDIVHAFCRNEHPKNGKNSMKLYFTRYTVLLILTIFAAALDTVLSMLLSRFFTLF